MLTFKISVSLRLREMTGGSSAPTVSTSCPNCDITCCVSASVSTPMVCEEAASDSEVVDRLPLKAWVTLRMPELSFSATSRVALSLLPEEEEALRCSF